MELLYSWQTQPYVDKWTQSDQGTLLCNEIHRLLRHSGSVCSPHRWLITADGNNNYEGGVARNTGVTFSSSNFTLTSYMLCWFVFQNSQRDFSGFLSHPRTPPRGFGFFPSSLVDHRSSSAVMEAVIWPSCYILIHIMVKGKTLASVL